MNNETIQLRNLSIGYQTRHGVKTVAEGISGSILSGQLTCLLGPNGVGKSTLLRTLSAFQPKTGGEVLFRSQETGVRRQESGDRSQESGDGYREIATFSDKELSRLIGVVLTEKPDVRNMTVRELVSLGRSPYTGFWGTYSKEDLRVVDEAITLVGIEALRQRMVHTLSDGERQKVMIAKALAQQTPVIFLDEPTAFLDYPSKVEMLQLLRRISREAEKTIFLSTHDVELALQLADTLWLMTGSIAIGSPKALAASGDLERFINGKDISFDKETLSIRVNSL